MSQNPKVPASGPDVYRPTPGDKRMMFPIPVGGKVLAARLPGPTRKGEAPPIVPEVIDMASRQISKRPLMEDPYHLDGV